MSYKRFFFVRLAWALFGAWFAVTGVFLIFYVVPSDPARLIAGPQAPPEALERAAEAFGLDRPILDQYGDFVWTLLRDQSAGPSLATRSDSGEIALTAAPATLSLLLAGFVVVLLVGVPAGLLASRMRGGRMLGRGLVYLAIGASPIWLGLLLATFLGHRLGFVAVGGYCDLLNPRTECGGPADWVSHLVLPGITFGLFFAAIYARVLARIMRVRGKDLGRRKALVMVRMVGRDFGYSLSAACFVEALFGIPGLGNVMVQSLNGFDAPVVSACFTLALLLAISFHFLVDVIVGALDSDLRAEWPVASVTGRA